MEQRYAVLKGGGIQKRVEPGQALDLGRSTACHVRVDDREVSRRHATIEWPGDQAAPRLIDHGGPNGTILDGECLSGVGVELRSRHHIQLGEAGPSFQLELFQPDGTPLAEGSSVRLFTEQGKELLGDLSSTPLELLLAELEETKRSGTLRLELEDGEVSLTYCLGQVMAAEGWGTSGMLVLKRCIQAKRGRYRFELDFEPVEDPMYAYASKLKELVETRPEAS